KGGLYHKTQINLAYNSNRIEGSRLTEEQTRYIFETRTIGFKDEEAVPVDDIIETSNHFVAFDYLIDTCLSTQDTYTELVNYFYPELQKHKKTINMSKFKKLKQLKIGNYFRELSVVIIGDKAWQENSWVKQLKFCRFVSAQFYRKTKE
ncbi:MAG: hypothetical protein LBU22_12455, partial [Dysgonamonadaceae bacterium]|nr:hypothetical protein [Dysgonamonadaceae bacterium]